jgi:hypothetical protein
LGEALMRTLPALRHEAIGLDRVPGPCTHHVGSITERAEVRARLQGVEAVIHTATLHKPHVATHSRQDFFDTNITGTLALLEEAVAAGASRFLFTSTTSTFGAALTPPPGAPAAWITEDVTPVPKNIYGATKLAAEALCELFARREGLPAVAFYTVFMAAPTVAPCRYPRAPWEGVDVPDHGAVWSLPWAVEAEGDQIRLGVEGVRLPYRMEKTVHLLGEGRVRLTYRLLNRSPFDMPFVWSSHPLFALRPGMRVDLPCSAVRVDLAARFAATHGDRLRWPVTADGLDLSRVPDASAGLAVKLFAETGPEGWAALVDPDDGASFRFDFDPAQITHLGLWLNYGGWAGSPGAAPYYTLALEPCISAPDALDAAVGHWRAHGLAPAEGAWWLELRAR